MAQPQPAAGIEDLYIEVVIPAHLVGKDEGYQAVVNKFESIRLLMLLIEAGRQDPRRSEIIRNKDRRGKLSYVRGNIAETSKNIGNLLKESKELREEITGRGAPDMPLPAPLTQWLEINNMQNKWQ